MNHPNELSNVEKIKQLVDYLNLQRKLCRTLSALYAF